MPNDQIQKEDKWDRYTLTTLDGEEKEVKIRKGLSFNDNIQIWRCVEGKVNQASVEAGEMDISISTQLQDAAVKRMVVSPVDWDNITAKSAQGFWTEVVSPLFLELQDDGPQMEGRHNAAGDGCSSGQGDASETPEPENA